MFDLCSIRLLFFFVSFQFNFCYGQNSVWHWLSWYHYCMCIRPDRYFFR